MLKKNLRIAMKQRLSELPESQRNSFSDIIQRKALRVIHTYAEAHGIPNPQVCTYVGMSQEVDTRTIISELLKKGSVWIPRCNGESMETCKIGSLDDLVAGAFGIPEPRTDILPTEADLKPDVMIIPGLSFDSHGNRLGRGKGYYDRFLSLNEISVKIGLAFDVQILDAVPVLQMDIPVDMVITESRIFEVNTGLRMPPIPADERRKVV